MNRRKAHLLSILATAVALGAFQTPSQARSTLASAGRAVNPADYNCFRLFFSSMTNYCSSVKRLEIALPVDASGWYTVTVNAQGASVANNVGCEAVGVNQSVTSYWAYGVRWLTAFGSPQNISTRTYVPSYGALYVYCDVYPNGRVNTINW